jgi:hypothetical protein
VSTVAATSSRRTELDIDHAPLGGQFAGQAELHLVPVDPDDAAVRSDQARQLERDRSATAAHVHAPQAGCDAGPVEQRHRVGVMFLSQQQQAIVSGPAATDHITVHERHAIAGST